MQSKATEAQLRHRLDSQVAEAENLRDELGAARERSEEAEAALRKAEQRTREGGDKKMKGLLAEMENLCRAKLLAENTASEMKAELEELRVSVASAEQRAAEEQSIFVRASEEKMSGLRQVIVWVGTGGGNLGPDAVVVVDALPISH